ncbi:inositol monophosphatase family protein [Ornithinicoccus hortensis]|uniref:Inositol-1-monophosphatase n=1 Tax=Ornithinicoccus hortensis TaxID=82346 RepID=A0A542YTS1_9MICO|nr:inositol monophosphatase family protein [Ornithinicoccus hortensis]TQL51467.1 myo-inositol-1(or 4)-monophosphatase [Ornithinicoccus hortensis]
MLPTPDWADARDVPPPARLADLEALAVDLAVRAGRFVRGDRPATVQVATTKSTPLDVVTAMDTGSEDLIRAELARRCPEDGVLGEEEGLTVGTSGLTWVVDPIDGTVNYLYDIPAYAVSVAVVVGDPRVPGGWLPVAGAVSNPRVDEVFRAHLGGGGCVHPMGEVAGYHPAGERPARAIALEVGQQTDPSLALVGTGFSYDRVERAAQAELALRVLAEVRDLRRIGSAALDLCSVAAGRFDAYYEAGLHAWDVAAGALLVREAGGVVTGLDAPGGRGPLLASGPALHGPLGTLIR